MIMPTSSPSINLPLPSTRDRRPWNRPDIAQPFADRTAKPVPLAHRNSRASLFESMRGMDLFSHLPDGDLLKLAAVARERRLEKNAPVLRGDDEGQRLLVVMDGEVAALREDGDGEETLVSTLRPGDTAGETALFQNSPEALFLKAATPARVLSLHREDLTRALRERPEFALDLLGDMARKLRQCQRRLAGICNQRTPHRVASTLLALLEERGVRLKDSEGRRCLLLRQRPTQKRIADLAGTTRETVSRLMARWERSGWLSDRHGDLMVLEEAKLRCAAGEEA